MYKVELSSAADKVIRKWKKSNPQLWKKYEKIYHELADHPRTGLGHPEALIGGNDITWSRHITAHDRIIYDIYDEVVTVLVVKLEGHYGDKWKYLLKSLAIPEEMAIFADKYMMKQLEVTNNVKQ